MKKATKLIEILTKNYTSVLPEKYVVPILQVATLEERAKVLMNFGLVDEAKEARSLVVDLIQAIRDESDK